MAKGGKTLIIVESPSKAKTINKYLGNDYIISSSMGHIIDLPKSRIAVDADNDFKPEYITIRGKAKILNELKKKASQASQVLLATDPDREGEAISWHLSNALKPKNDNIKRIEFNEITEPAVKEAVDNPREIDINLVNAQQARRILDRIVGYNISPILWKKVRKGLSAGRVQSVALRVICEREREIENFIPEEYWTLEAVFQHDGKKFTGSLFTLNGERVKLTKKEEAEKILADLEGKSFTVQSVQKKERKRNAPAPYITSKLQQDAANRLGFTTTKTMIIAQQLYEGVSLTDEGPVGLITYMRTDSTRVSDTALNSVRNYITGNFSEGYLPKKANFFSNKKNAQDAHEAIRPSDVNRTPDSVKKDLSREQFKIYDLIWKRFVASQMTPEVSEVCTVLLGAGAVVFKAIGSRVVFEGFTAVDRDDKTRKMDLPKMKEGDAVEVREYLPEQHFTTPPPRYNDASLVKFLEESGIGRPSTYAPTITTLITRYYAVRSGRQLVPTVLGRLVNDIMVNHFPSLVSIDFTAQMEDKLDHVEDSSTNWVDMLREFYGPFKINVDDADHRIEEMKNILDEETEEICENCGRKMVKKLGRYGFFLACPGFPECRNAKSLPLGKCPQPDCTGDVVKRSSRKGRPFYACSRYPDCTFITRETPADKPCPKCGSLLFSKKIRGKGQMLTCLKESCGFKIELLDSENNGALKTDNGNNGSEEQRDN